MHLHAHAAPRGPSVTEFNALWSVTLPARLELPELDTPPAATPFREPIRGLVTREVHAPELFEHFFG